MRIGSFVTRFPTALNTAFAMAAVDLWSHRFDSARAAGGRSSAQPGVTSDSTQLTIDSTIAAQMAVHQKSWM